MKKVLLSLISLWLVFILVFTANAYMLGDVDMDNNISAMDARFALRASVGLDDGLTEEQLLAADVDGVPGITANDARLILRAAVGLEDLHIHEYGEWTIKEEVTCENTGLRESECECGDILSEEIPAEHNFENSICTYCEKNIADVLPRLYFTGNISGMYSKSDVRDIEIKYSYGEESFEGFATLKVQGTSSLAYEKKNYTINFFEDEAHDDKLKVDVGWGKQNKYCLKANWIDKTHSRNIVTANLVTEMQKKYGLLEEAPANGAIDGFPIEIYSNGEFLGIYTFNIPKDEWMFNMDKNNPDHLVFCGENRTAATYFSAEPDFASWAIEVGEENEESLNKLKNLSAFIRNSSDEEFKENFEEHLNLDATLNYYIMADFAFLPDNLEKNMLLVTYDGKIWYPSLYDLDTSWGAHWDGKSLFDYQNNELNFSASKLWNRLVNNFSEELSERYFELREDILTYDNVMSKFEDFKASIPEETFEKEIERWGTKIPGYDLSQIEEYLDFMIDKLDAKYAAWKAPDIGEEPSTEEVPPENTEFSTQAP